MKDIKQIKAEYDKLKSEGKLSLRSSKQTNILDNLMIKQISESWSLHVDVSGKTIVPFDMANVIAESGIKSDFAHARDRSLRAFEVFALSKVAPEEITKLKGLHSKHTTETLRKHLVRGKHMIVESNKELSKCFVSVDLTDLITL